MFKPKSGGLMLLESLLPPEIWAGIKKASEDIPQVVATIQQTMQSVDARLELILTKLERIEMKLDPSAAQPVTALSLLDERVQTNSFSDEDAETMRCGRLTDEDIAMLDANPPTELR